MEWDVIRAQNAANKENLTLSHSVDAPPLSLQV